MTQGYILKRWKPEKVYDIERYFSMEACKIYTE